MAREPEVIIYQTASEKERQAASAGSAGIDENNPAPMPGGNIGDQTYQNFKVRKSGSIGYEGFTDDSGDGLDVQQF